MKENMAANANSLSQNSFPAKFKSLSAKDILSHEEVYTEVIDRVALSGYREADSGEVFSVLNDYDNLCRNENLEKVLDLIGGISSIKIKSFDNDLNLNSCKVMNGQGFRIAMIEGFGGASLGNKLQVVMTFKPNNITNKKQASASDEIYKTKPDTAKVSLQIEGEIKKEDVEMISIRIPKVLISEDYMTEEEFENEESKFIIRHYIVK